MKMFDVYPINNVNIVRAKNMTLWDDKGVEYLDMYGGHAVISIGHTADRYVDYINKQLGEIGFYSNSIEIPIQQKLANAISKISGRDNYSLFLCNSGAEANENALKLASFYNGRKRIIAFCGSFHGRTSLAVAATDNPSIVAEINQTENITFLPYNDINALKTEFAKGEVCCVILEAIQGVGGITMASDEFVLAIRELCDASGAVMIADCVQCGCARSGKYFAMDHSGVSADIYSMAKGIGNGFPIGAIMISDKFAPKYGMLGTTFGGNHLACAAALAVAEEIDEKGLMDNAANIGAYLIDSLKAIKNPKLVEVRGRGLMIGVVLCEDSKAVRSKLLSQERVFVGSASDNRIVRLLPSLTITKQQCDTFIESFKRVL